MSGVRRKARVVDGGAREENSCTPSLSGVPRTRRRRERPPARREARARDVARTFSSAAIVAHLARRAVSSAPRTARRHRSTRARRVVARSVSNTARGFSKSRHAGLTVWRLREGRGRFLVWVTSKHFEHIILCDHL